MSRIFDALQRSEAERSGTKGSPAPDATELLRHAERRAVSEWEISAPPQLEVRTERSLAKNGHASGSNGVAANGSNGARRKEPAVPEEPITERPAIFDSFQLLRVSAPAQGRLVSVSDKDSPAAEAFRLLAVRLRHLRRDRPLKKVLITSSIPQEGKSTCSANLACSLALRPQQRTLLIDGDIRRPSLAPMFGLAPRPGICEWLREERELEEVIYFLEGPGLWFMPAGSSTSNPLALLQSGRISVLTDKLAELFDWVIIDSPPVLPLADTSIWSRLCDGILLVARQGTSEKRQLQRGVESIERQKLIGAILNSSNSAPHSDYYYSPRAGSGTSPT
ncbi:MAG TPA: CpsD/CapB family tyrosine-protein kinase [Acidobacteriaceae bacterium]|jgi:capsular exopolysaccharide synthesis family protein|nr:CpsD/CapB family tyrosine-protein kinase [Acidobacteriaceae bacterium]